MASSSTSYSKWYGNFRELALRTTMTLDMFKRESCNSRLMNDPSPYGLLPLIGSIPPSMSAALATVMTGGYGFVLSIVVLVGLIGLVKRVIPAAFLFTATLWALSGVSPAQEVSPPPQDSRWQLPAAIRYQSLRRTKPRLLRIHVLRIDLTSDAIALGVGIGKDPDRAGPVEALLTAPSELAEEKGMFAAVNTNAWTMIPDPSSGKNPGYVAGGHADIKGWVFASEGQRSNKEDGYWSCWMEQNGRCRIGMLEEGQAHGAALQRPAWAVSGFRGILKDGKVLVTPSEVLHPRTAVGLSADARWMTWIVVDGRQPGYSLGVSEEELARLLLEEGCTDGINLDGGGSSVLLLADRSGRLQLANQPSNFGRPRPVPVILGVTYKK
jgi:hypothetical protein